MRVYIYIYLHLVYLCFFGLCAHVMKYARFRYHSYCTRLVPFNQTHICQQVDPGDPHRPGWAATWRTSHRQCLGLGSIACCVKGNEWETNRHLGRCSMRQIEITKFKDMWKSTISWWVQVEFSSMRDKVWCPMWMAGSFFGFKGEKKQAYEWSHCHAIWMLVSLDLRRVHTLELISQMTVGFIRARVFPSIHIWYDPPGYGMSWPPSPIWKYI